MKKKGFTLLEIMVVGAFAALLLILFFIQKANVDAMDRDDQRKTAINAMYYSLEEGFYKENGYYPTEISEKNLKTMDPELFTDPMGINLGSEGSSYSYEAEDCDYENHCKGYTLRAELEKESSYIKKNRTN